MIVALKIFVVCLKEKKKKSMIWKMFLSLDRHKKTFFITWGMCNIIFKTSRDRILLYFVQFVVYNSVSEVKGFIYHDSDDVCYWCLVFQKQYYMASNIIKHSNQHGILYLISSMKLILALMWIICIYTLLSYVFACYFIHIHSDI